MRFTETHLKGAFVLEIEERKDDRGAFARTFCMKEFTDHGLKPTVAQCNLSYNYKAGTLRGMHFQEPPHAEAKLVRCTAGAIYDVIIDLRPESPTYCRWFGIELRADQHDSLYVPERFAHGYQTLTDNAEICYQTSMPYHAASARGVRHDDPEFDIKWPLPVSCISEADAGWPAWKLQKT
jgi:dTDP-4-dehydrorhamnose 3,5-epimerase